MNKSIGVRLVVYSLLLAGLSYFAYRLAPALTQATLTTGLVGSALCLVWGVWAICGSRRKVWAMLTLVPVGFMLLAQTVIGWSGGVTAVPGRGTAAAVTTVLLLLSLAMLMRIAYAGVVFEGQPTGPKLNEAAASGGSSERALRIHVDRHA